MDVDETLQATIRDATSSVDKT
jgi:hypothetical protein